MSRLLCEQSVRHVLAARQLTCISWPMYESVRHHLKRRKKEPIRKPIWTPIAPSKLFRIRNKPELTADESQQRQHLEYNYALSVRSITHYFKHEFYDPTLSGGGLTDEQIRLEAENQQKLINENNKENERIAEIREQRMKTLQQLADQRTIVQFLEHTEQMKLKGKELDERVRQEIQRSETYITLETLDATIEEALTHPITYDFAIDNNGNIYSDQPLHPYALRPSDTPDHNSNIEEMTKIDEIATKFESKTFY
ncbi:probable 28S ribosomal protein S26, mitochondrial [Oppia nitens]|uniref:probable 28S ribosomal protein S26, mitochondrial n=1 Tax=Oppia nitens TaxID=1686743 RepID=UPI0023DB7B59|nr:probable 28S ribosomal protein S26, mitochondrial [Oppia nitens]